MKYSEIIENVRLNIDDVYKSRFKDLQLIPFLNSALRKVLRDLVILDAISNVKETTVTMDDTVVALDFAFYKIVGVQDSNGYPIDIVRESAARRNNDRVVFLRGHDYIGWYVSVTDSFDLTVQYIPKLNIIVTKTEPISWMDDAGRVVNNLLEDYSDVVVLYTSYLALGPNKSNSDTYRQLYKEWYEDMVAMNSSDIQVVDTDDYC